MLNSIKNLNLTEMELKISKQVLFRTLKSDCVNSLAHGLGSIILNFMRRSIEPCEPAFAFHNRKDVFALEEFTNSSAEGLFYGTKNGPAKVRGTLYLPLNPLSYLLGSLE